MHVPTPICTYLFALDSVYFPIFINYPFQPWYHPPLPAPRSYTKAKVPAMTPMATLTPCSEAVTVRKKSCEQSWQPNGLQTDVELCFLPGFNNRKWGMFTLNNSSVHGTCLFLCLVKQIAKCQGLKTAWKSHSFQALVKPFAKCQVFNGFGEMAQILGGCCACYPRHSLQCKLFLRDWQTLDSTPRSIQICWNIGARECCSLAHDALRLQFFVQYQRWVKVMQGELRAFFLRKLLWNHSVHFPTSTGTIELQHASFPIQALYRKIE